MTIIEIETKIVGKKTNKHQQKVKIKKTNNTRLGEAERESVEQERDRGEGKRGGRRIRKLCNRLQRQS